MDVHLLPNGLNLTAAFELCCYGSTFVQ